MDGRATQTLVQVELGSQPHALRVVEAHSSQQTQRSLANPRVDPAWLLQTTRVAVPIRPTTWSLSVDLYHLRALSSPQPCASCVDALLLSTHEADLLENSSAAP